ncbi:MAG: LTA synthase family protein [Methylophaga sp.]|nr:LTA synthase family protein [Methylophaga sp.]
MSIAKQLFKYYLLMISIFFVGRAALFVLYFDKFKDSDVNYWLTFIYGLRMDTIAAGMLLIIPLLLLCLSPNFLKKIVDSFLKYYFLIVLAVLIYIENATFPFFAQYDVRPNYLFVEYLAYPKEVFGMIFADYKVELLIAFAMLAGFIYLYLKHTKNSFIVVFDTSYIKRLVWFLPLAFILLVAVRSSFGHRPANNSDAMYSSNRAVNEITKNSIYSIYYAVYTNIRHGSGKSIKQYGKMPIEEALSRVKKRLGIDSINELSPLSRIEPTHFKTENSKNLVIFIQESMGYQFVEAVGGEKGITPNLNRLSKEGIVFKDLYSNGTRSIRGLAGSVAGNFSVPGKGVLKRNKSQTDFFTIASLLEPYGYHSMFIYGGESRFDNMRGWFLGNGFDQIIDQPQFEDPSFVGTWGVSDEDLVIKSNEEFKKLYAKDQKFVAVMFSTSNHSPFDFPGGKIDLVEGVKVRSDTNAIKYADYAIGQFIDQAREEAYYKDTVFVIVADHNIRVYGDDMVPVDMFHIPGLILGEGIEAKAYEELATQPDVLATALDLIGLDLSYPIMGHSIFSDQKQNMALMQFFESYALRVDNKIAVIRPGKPPITFLYKGKHLVEVTSDDELEKDALAFVVTLDHLYHEKKYR